MKDLSAASDFEEETLVILRTPKLVLNDAQQMAALLCDMTNSRGEPLYETKALHWFAHRLLNRLDLLNTLIGGCRPDPKFLSREMGEET